LLKGEIGELQDKKWDGIFFSKERAEDFRFRQRMVRKQGES